jgi:hypothetical protein
MLKHKSEARSVSAGRPAGGKWEVESGKWEVCAHRAIDTISVDTISKEVWAHLAGSAASASS